MEIVLNGERREVGEGQTLLDLLENLQIPRDAVVIELNAAIVDRADFGTMALSAGDVIELVRVVGGG